MEEQLCYGYEIVVLGNEIVILGNKIEFLGDIDPCLSLDHLFLDLSTLEICINFALYKSFYYYYF